MVSLLDGLRKTWPESEIKYARGVDIDSEDLSGIPAAFELARQSDLVILCVGEARQMSGEAGCRARPGLPGKQAALADAVLDTGKPVVALLSCGRPLAVSWLFERASAVLATWYLGSEAGNAVGDVLSGRFNPSARLPVSWPVDVGQIPVFYSRLPTGRPFDANIRYTSKYLDIPNEPLFPFGHGLSYTRFKLSNLRAVPPELRRGGSVKVDVDVVNEGKVAGDETVLLFVRDPVATLSRPVLELKGMAKITLAPGARGSVRLKLTTDDLSFIGTDLEPKLEPGTFEIFVGPSAKKEDLLQTTIRLLP
jgi:beta-glucosidase